MLTRLSLRDFAVVTASELAFGPGMTVISGETGAGKSLLVDAMHFLSGARADAGMVRHGSERAELEAEFDLDDCPAAHDWLAAQELDDVDAPDTCQLRRVLRADGGSKAWINGRAATLAQLTELAALLIEIHGQHEHQSLLDKKAQLALLDAWGRHPDLLAAVQATATQWHTLLREREALRQRSDATGQLDYLQHQLDELDAESLDADAIYAVIATHKRQAHAAELIAACDAAATQLSGDADASPTKALAQLRAGLARVLAHESRLGDVDALLDAAAIQLDEAAQLLERIRSDLDLDPQQLQTLEQTLSRLHDLARKHRVPVEQLGERRDALRSEIDTLRHLDERLARIDADLAQADARWRAAASTLTDARDSAARSLGSAVTTLLGELGMGGGVFVPQLEPVDAGKPDPQGAERVELLVSANAGQPPRPLRKVASGGELSRIALAIEVAALGLDAIPTMIFDEVDSGIGGAVADIVGQKLRALGAARQVLCVTHLPQVAAQGHAHYQVRKGQADGITQSEVQVLDDGGRIDELARMLGGVEVGREARAAAKKLLVDAAKS